MIKAIVFDFTGVVRSDALEAWLAHNNLKMNDKYYDLSNQQDLGQISNDEFYQEISKLFGREMTAEDINSHADINYELVDLITDLKKHYKIALLSNSPIGFVRNILRDKQLDKLFSDIVISSEVHLIKPDPEIFNLVLDKLQVDKSEAVFIDDNIGHVKAAKQLGLISIIYTSFNQLKSDLQSLGIKE